MLDRKCKQCGVEFQSKPSAGARINYCSRWCQGLSMNRKSPVRSMTVTEAAYLAGLIDGEGTVSVSDRRASRPGSSHPSIYLSIAGTYLPMHDWLIATTGIGRLAKNVVSPTALITSRKDCYSWRVQSANAVDILRQTHPYMVEKAERADRAIRSFDVGYSVLDGIATSSLPITPIFNGTA